MRSFDYSYRVNLCQSAEGTGMHNLFRSICGFFKQHAFDAASLGASLGLTGLFAFMADARDMLAQHPVASLALTAAAFAVGFTTSRIVFQAGKWAERRRKCEKLELVFSAMPKRRKELVAQMLDSGEIETTPYDSDVNTLCKQRIFLKPDIAPGAIRATYCMNPNVVREVAEHRAEWIGM